MVASKPSLNGSGVTLPKCEECGRQTVRIDGGRAYCDAKPWPHATNLPNQPLTGPQTPTLNSLNSFISYPVPEKKRPTLDDTALYGIAGDLVREIEPHTESDRAALLGGILVDFGSAAGRNGYAQLEGDLHYMNENLVKVGSSSHGRKGTARGRVGAFYVKVDPQWASNCQASGLSSGEGLIYAVRDEVSATRKGQIEVIDAGVKDKRLLVVEPEFASVLKVATREGNILSPVVRQGWDHGNLRVLTRNNPLRATDAHISIDADITDQELHKYFTETEAANGFGNRFLWLSVERSKFLPEGGGSPDLGPLVNWFQQALTFASEPREFRRDDEARELWAKEYPKLSKGAPGLYGAVTSRAEAHVLRLSVIYAALDQSPTIQIQHLQAALSFWKYCDESAAYIFGDATGDWVADRILEALRQSDGMSKTDLHRLFGNNTASARIGSALEMLESIGKARREQAIPNGRTVDVWKA